MNSPVVPKHEVRTATVARTLALDPVTRAAEERALARRFLDLPGFATAGLVGLYASAFPEEIDTAPLMILSLDRGKRLALPKVLWRTRRMTFHEVTDPARDLVPGRLGIPEPRPECPAVAPEALDWLLVPGVAFDGQAHRLGRGAGLYDRFLPTLRPDAPRWALALESQWVDSVPVESHDAPLDGVVSASRRVQREGSR